MNLKNAPEKTYEKAEGEFITAVEKDENNVEHVYVKSSKKRSTVLLIASIVATVCFIYVYNYMSQTASGINSKDAATALGTGIALSMATPSVIMSGLGTVFAWLGYFCRTRGFALTAGILFAVAIALMFPWFMFNIVQMILCFVAYAKMKK